MPALWPFSLLFGLLVCLRRLLYRVGIFSVSSRERPGYRRAVVVAGGSGKTPVVMALVKHLQARGLKPGVGHMVTDGAPQIAGKSRPAARHRRWATSRR